MSHAKKLKIRIAGILKDKASIVRAALSARRARISIVRATTHDATNPPPDHRVASVLAWGNGSRVTAGTCIKALMDRLHGTSNAAVALKALFLINNVVSKGSFILKDQLSIFPSSGGHNFLNLSSFRDGSGPESWEMSAWVRWYAGVLEQNLAASRILGHHFSSVTSSDQKLKVVVAGDRVGMILELMNSDLLCELHALVRFVEEICKTPDSLNLQKNNLVYEVVRLVGEDYRYCQVELSVRVIELGQRIASLSFDELTRSVSVLTRLENCRDGLTLLFVNRKRNDRMWDLVGETSLKLRERVDMEERRRDESSEVTRFLRRVAESGRLLRLKSAGGLSGLDRMQLAVSTVG